MFRREAANFIKRFVVIYGLTMLATFFICLVFNPEVQVGVVWYFGRCILFSIVADASSLVYVSGSELSYNQWWGRTILQCVILEVTLMPLGYLWGMWNGALGGVVIFFVILLVNVCVRLVGYGQDRAEADILNQRLQERREQQSREKEKENGI